MDWPIVAFVVVPAIWIIGYLQGYFEGRAAERDKQVVERRLAEIGKRR